KHPLEMPDLLRILPDTPEIRACLKRLLESHSAKEFSSNGRERVVEYLRRHSEAYRADLITAVRNSHDGTGWVEGDDDMRALARLSWPDAAPILASLAASPQKRTSVVALSFLYEHAVAATDSHAPSYRRQLKAIATNPSQPGYARSVAITALMA